MIIHSSIKSTVTPSDKAAALAAYVSDDSHVVSVSSDVARTFPLRAGPGIGIGESILQEIGLDGDDDAVRHFRSSIWKAAKKAISEDAVGKGSINGVELILSSRSAFAAFADAKAKPIAKLDATAGALKDAIGAAQAFWPALKDNKYVQVVSLIVTVGGLVIKVEAELADDKAQSYRPFK